MVFDSVKKISRIEDAIYFYEKAELEMVMLLYKNKWEDDDASIKVSFSLSKFDIVMEDNAVKNIRPMKDGISKLWKRMDDET